jgi:hypothetical protein
VFTLTTASHRTPLFNQSPPRHRPAARSLEREYQAYLQFEIEEYKDSLSRDALLRLGDEAVRNLAATAQIQLTELLVNEEVNRLIAKRAKLQSKRSFAANFLKRQAELRRPGRWGLAADAPIVSAVPSVELASVANVLVAGGGERQHGPALFLAAQGFAVTTLDSDYDAIERVMNAADANGLANNVRGFVGQLAQWAPDVRFQAVVCSPDAVLGIDRDVERLRVLGALKDATVDGGVHLYESDPNDEDAISPDALTSSYAGWTVALESRGACRLMLARKGAAA